MTEFAPRPTFDLVMVGGGIVGCGIARDASLRGLSVALIEKNDRQRHDLGFDTADTWRPPLSGDRRLQAGPTRSSRARDPAPHRPAPGKPLPFLLPLPKSRCGRKRLKIGMWLYDRLSFDKTLPHHRIVSAAELRQPNRAWIRRIPRRRGVLRRPVRVPRAAGPRERRRRAAHGARFGTTPRSRGDPRRRPARRGPGSKGERRRPELRGRSWSTPAARGSTRSRRGSSRRTRRASATPRASTSPASRSRSTPSPGIVGRRPRGVRDSLDGSHLDRHDRHRFRRRPGQPASATDDDIRYLIDSLAPQLPAIQRRDKHWTGAGVRALVRSDGSGPVVPLGSTR